MLTYPARIPWWELLEESLLKNLNRWGNIKWRANNMNPILIESIWKYQLEKTKELVQMIKKFPEKCEKTFEVEWNLIQCQAQLLNLFGSN